MITLSNIRGFLRSTVLPLSAAGVMAAARREAAVGPQDKTMGTAGTGAWSRQARRWIGLLAAMTLLSGLGWYLYGLQTASAPPTSAQTPAGYISNDQLEAQYGVRITLIAVTAAGGIVDFRYRVVDPAKASSLLHDPANSPILTVADNGLTLSPTHMGRHQNHMAMKKGAVPFSFYPNVRGAVKPGTRVSAAFGNVRVEPMAAQ